MKLVKRLVLLFALESFLALTGFGQEPKPVASPNSPPPGPAQKSEQEKEIEKQEQSQRILGMLPQFGVTSRHDAPPLTPSGKFHLFTKAAFDPVEFGLVGFQAGISQAEDEFPGYGQGAGGYGKRYGAAFADEVSSGFWSNYFYPVLLKEDPRYFRSGSGSIKHRMGYAVVQEFVCHTDAGGRSFSFSNFLGAFTSGGLSNIYYPQSDRGATLTLSRSAIALMYGSLGGLVDEFWPDISRAMFKKHKKDGPNP
ncbi:MAG TPA: hypothetical protein VFA74_09655 [Terriglobales bacterium]|nr:hypothetical protein [Terriglobales bacterium]